MLSQRNYTDITDHPGENFCKCFNILNRAGARILFNYHLLCGVKPSKTNTNYSLWEYVYTHICIFIGNKMGFYSTFVCHGIVKHVVSSKLGSRSDSAGKHDIVRDVGDNSHTSPPFKKEIKLSSVGSVP